MIDRGSVRYQKNWLRNDNRTQETVPKTHIRNVRTGREGSSVVGTVKATCLTGEFSSVSCSCWISDLEFAAIASDDEEDADEIFLESSTFSSLVTVRIDKHPKEGTISD